MKSRKSIDLQDQIIEYKLRESRRARCLRITIYPGGELAATLPQGMNLERLEDFLRQKSDWILRKMDLAKKRKSGLILPRASRKEYLTKKSEALAIAKKKIKYFGELYNLMPKRLCIRNQKTRWGSCSQKGNINFNYRLVHLPEKFLDYVVVHELCHLKEFNHSERFWNLVAVAIPDYKSIRKEIRSL
jgi:predicted metal-dependent hydrolase